MRKKLIMRKKFFTHTDRLESLAKRSQLIKESFQREFSKIKRIDEDTVYQGLDELDYGNLYAKTNPWDKQQIKIDDYPAEGKMLDTNIQSAELAIKGDRSQRERFLMDDNALREYLDKLYKIKNALEKHESGEQLDDFEKRIVRYYKSNKQFQKSRISSMAGDKLDSNFVDNFDKSIFSEFLNGKPIGVISRRDKNRYEATLIDIKAEKANSSDVRLVGKCNINGQNAIFYMYQDGSNGFTDESNEDNDELISLYIYDEEFRRLASGMLSKIRPKRDY